MTTKADVELIRVFLGCAVRDGDFSKSLLTQFEAEAREWARKQAQLDAADAVLVEQAPVLRALADR